MNTNKDLYNILGVSREASESDIKKSYKKLALRYHPDRQGNKSEKEKKDAEEKFKEISWAYSILSDPDKKQRYDQYGITDDQQGGFNDFDASDLFKHFMGGFGDFNPFGSFFGNNNDHNRRSQHEDGQSVNLQVPVSIKELLNGVHKDVKYDILVRCNSCNGSGGEGVEACPHCHGTGMLTETRRTAFGIIQNSSPCQFCNGTGQIIKHKCSKCQGKGLIKTETSIRIDVNGGFENGSQLIFANKGYEGKSPLSKNGSLRVILVYNFDQNKYHIQNNNIYEVVEIPYYNCILGCKKEHILPNDEKITIKIPEYTQDNAIINTNKYFGHYAYNIIVRVKMPTYIRNTEKKLLKELQNENKK